MPAEPLGLVIFAHGSGSSRNSPRNRQVAGEMHARNLATLLFDLLTPAEADAEATTGELRFDIPFLAGRLLAACRWAQRHPATRHLPIGFFGASTGAAAALAVAAQVTETRAVVSRGGRSDLAGDAVRHVMCPTLLIVGSLDVPVVRWNQQTLEQLRGEKQLALVEGATHLFPEPGALERVAQLAGDWFAEHFNTPPPP